MSWQDEGDVIAARLGGPYRRLQQGRWSAEVRGDEVADIRFGGVLLLRAVRPVVRDRDWSTVPVRVVEHHLDTTDAGLRFTADLRFDGLGIAYAATVTVTLDERDLSVDFDGRALGDFDRNRIGLVVLHPPADAGSAVRVRHADGTVTEGTWPSAVGPHQPFRDVQGFEWTTDGVTATLTLTGDTFETEDQRNWTDASFKTYSTPLSLPFPVAVREGETCRQSARLSVSGQPEVTAVRVSDDADQVTVDAAVVGVVPPIGLGATLHPPGEVAPRGVTYDSVLLELVGDPRTWPGQVAAAAGQAGALSAALDVRIVTADADVIDQAVDLLTGIPVVRLGAYDPVAHITTAELLEALRGAVRRHGSIAQVVGGTRAHFTELNRQIAQIPADLPALTFSLTPQMHATEIPHLLDSLAMQRVVAENARRLAGDRPVLVGPITLARRFNAVATSGTADPARDAERATDPLQPTAFTGVWTLGSIAQLTLAGVAAISYFEVAGPRGILGADGGPTPAGEVLDRVVSWRGRPVLDARGPNDVAVLAVLTEGRVEVILGNLSARSRTVTVRGVTGEDRVALAPWGRAGVSVGLGS